MRTLADRFVISKKSLSAFMGLSESCIWNYIHHADLPAFRPFPGPSSYIWAEILTLNKWRRIWLQSNGEGYYLRTLAEMAAFSGWSAETVQLYIKRGELPTTMNYPSRGREYWVKRSVMAEFMIEHQAKKLGALPIPNADETIDSGADELRSLTEIAHFMNLSRSTVTGYIQSGFLPVRRPRFAGDCRASRSAIETVLIDASVNPQCRVRRPRDLGAPIGGKPLACRLR